MGVIKKNWPEFIASLLVIGLLWKVFEQSVLEHHFIIPTMFFTPAVVIGNVIFYSFPEVNILKRNVDKVQYYPNINTDMC